MRTPDLRFTRFSTIEHAPESGCRHTCPTRHPTHRTKTIDGHPTISIIFIISTNIFLTNDGIPDLIQTPGSFIVKPKNKRIRLPFSTLYNPNKENTWQGITKYFSLRFHPLIAIQNSIEVKRYPIS